MLVSKFVSLRAPDFYVLIVDATLVQDNLADSYTELHPESDHRAWSLDQFVELELRIIDDLVQLIKESPIVRLKDGTRLALDSLPALRSAAAIPTCAYGHIPGTICRFVDLAHRDGPQKGLSHGR